MKAVIVALTLSLLTACGMTPAKHALVAVSASIALKGMAEFVNKEAAADYDAHGGENISDADAQALEAHWGPIKEAVDAAVKVDELYAVAAAKADQSGDSSIIAPVARQFVAAWVDVQTSADQMGVPFPKPPEKLLKFLERGAQ